LIPEVDRETGRICRKILLDITVDGDMNDREGKGQRVHVTSKAKSIIFTKVFVLVHD
jgi:hypothetical protein